MHHSVPDQRLAPGLGAATLLLHTLLVSSAAAQAPEPDLSTTEMAVPKAPEMPAAAPKQRIDSSPAVPSPATPPRGTKPSTTGRDAETAPPQPFGANLFMGNFLRAREDGVNPDYTVMPGDRVAVYAWGIVNINDVFVVDGQGNMFLPEIGPIHLEGVKNSQLTDVVEKHIRKVYLRNFGVYTNLLTAKPVAVFVTGGVSRPGRYAGVPSDSVLFFLDQAGGVDPMLGSYRNITILREGQEIADVDLYAFMLQGELPAVQFRDGDTILVKKRGPAVELQGDVAAPSLVELKQSPTSGAEALAVIPKTARATEVTIEGLRGGVPYNETLSVGQLPAAELRDGDVVTVRDDGRAGTILVNLEGEFDGPSVLSVQRGARLIDVLNYVKVDPRLTYTGAVHVRRKSVARAQKEAIENSLFRLERSALLALSSSQGEADIRVKEAELMQKFAERARLIDPLGRLVTSARGVQLNILLEDGDTIVIPGRTNVIRVGGEVQMSHAVMHRPNLTAEDYIELAGGYSDRADEGVVIILHPNAAVDVVDPDTTVMPGDEILVPPKVDTKLLQNAVDVTQVIYQVAVAAAVILAL